MTGKTGKRLAAGLFSFLSVIGLLLGSSGHPIAEAGAKILFSEDFESGTISADRWTIKEDCPFTVVNDPENPSNKVLVCPKGKGEDTWSKITTKASFDNFTLTMKAYVVAELSGTFGFSTRVTGQTSFCATFNHTWKGQFGYSGAGDIYTEKMVITGGMWHDIRYIADGDTYEIYVDGDQRATTTDSHLKSGPIEFSYWNKLFYLDEIVVMEGRVDEPQEDTSGNKTYYVDAEAVTGGDGLTPETAWNSVAQVNRKKAFYPGDTILFKRGGVYSGITLSPKGSGSPDKPITISSYGDGALPVIDRASKDWCQNTFTLTNQSYWTIENIQIQASNPANPGKLEDAQISADGSGSFPIRGALGIEAKYIDGQNSYVVRGINVRNCVFTLVDTSGGDEGNSYKNATGKSIGCGGGACSISASCSDDGQYNAWVDGFTVENCVFYNCGGTAVSSGFGGQLPNKNVVVRNNLMYCDEDFNASNHAVYLANTDGALVEYNTVYNLTCGMAFQNSRDGTMRYNVILNLDGYMHSASKLAGKALYWDACGLDVDSNCGGTMTFEGNLTYRCQDGALAAFEYKPSPKCQIVYKNNVSYEDGTLFYFDAETLNYKFIFSNNTVIRTKAAQKYATELITQMRRFGSTPLKDPGTFRFENNVFCFPDGFVKLDEEFCVYSGNIFTGNYPANAALVADKNLDAQLRIPTAEQMKGLSFCGNTKDTTGWYNSKFFAPLSGSPCLSGGKTAAGVDFSVLKAGADAFAVLYPEAPVDPTNPFEPNDPAIPTPSDSSDGSQPNSSISTQGGPSESVAEDSILGESGNRTLVIILVIAAVIVAGSGGAAVWWFLREKAVAAPASNMPETAQEEAPKSEGEDAPLPPQ